MVLSLAPSVFAAEEPRITVAVDKTSVKAGETVTFTYESTAAVTEMMKLEVWLAYDGDAFEYVSVDTEGSVWLENPEVTGCSMLFGYPVFVLTERKDMEEDVDAGKMFSVTFRALETITDVKEASFYNCDDVTNWLYEWEDHTGQNGYFDHCDGDPIYVVVTPKGTEPIATPTGYSVSMGADQTVAADQKVLIPVTVNSSRATVTGFNAYDMTFTYDPAATIADADTTVTGLWNVTLPEGFRSAGGVDTVEDGGDFTFTAPDAHYDYVLNVTTNGKTEEVTMKGNNSYTIENVTDNVTVTEKSRTAKTYTLKFVVDDRSAETLGTTPLTLADLGITDETVEVQYPNNYEFTVKFPGTGRYFGATISPDKNRFVKPLGDVSENGDCTYTLDGSKLTGDENGEITITINVYAWRNQITIGVGGNGAEDFDNGNELTCYPTENYTFTVNKSEYYDYTVTATYWQKKLSGYWDTVRLTVRDNGDGTYTIVRMPEIIERYELANVDVTITITKTAKAVDPDAVAAYEYVQLDGKTVVLVTVTGRPGSGKVFTYDGNAMFKANNYGWDLYSWLLILDKGEALDVDALKADVISKLALDDGTATTISQVYDVNKSSRMDINDAQLVYDIYNGTYFDFTKVSMEKFLLADVNCDKMVNSADAVVIVGQFR